MNVVMRAATSRASMPERFSAHAVSAMPPAPALANSRVAAWPASVISVLARSPMRVPPPSTETARNRIAWPTKDSASSTSAKASHPRWPSASLRPDVGEIGQGRGDDDEAGDHHRARDHEHDHLPRGDAAKGQRAVGLVDGGHRRHPVARGCVLRLGDHPKGGCGYPPMRKQFGAMHERRCGEREPGELDRARARAAARGRGRRRPARAARRRRRRRSAARRGTRRRGRSRRARRAARRSPARRSSARRRGPRARPRGRASGWSAGTATASGSSRTSATAARPPAAAAGR